MALGVRTYGGTLLVQNLFNPDNLPNTVPLIKNFAKKILRPTLTCTEVDCGTNIGRLLDLPESDPIGLVNLEDESFITDEEVNERILDDIYYIRVRDTSTCLSTSGFCRNCGRGYVARSGGEQVSLNSLYTFKGSPRAYQNYISDTFSGSLMGWLTVSSDPLPITPDKWSSVTTHGEMDSICRLLKPLGVPNDIYDYMFKVTDILERALLIIGNYGVYGNVQR